MSFENIIDDRNNESTGGGVYTEQDIINGIKECYKNVDNFSQVVYNEYSRENDHIPHSETIRRKIGWDTALEKAGVDKRGYTDDELYDAIKQFHNDTNSLSYNDYDNYSKNRDDLPSATTISRRIGWADILNDLDLNGDHYKYSREQIVEELNQLDEPISKSDVKEKCSFSSICISRYGYMSFVKGLNNLGFRATSKGKSISKTKLSESNKIRKKIRSVEDGYNSEYVGFVYVINFKRCTDGQMYCYVGSVDRNKGLLNRVNDHISRGGSFSNPYDSSDDVEYEINEMLDIEVIEAGLFETVKKTNQRIKKKERLKKEMKWFLNIMKREELLVANNSEL